MFCPHPTTTYATQAAANFGMDHLVPQCNVQVLIPQACNWNTSNHPISTGGTSCGSRNHHHDRFFMNSFSNQSKLL
jgi:hypothetical protein